MRIVCISDTHDLHHELEVPHGDMLIHAGDFTFFGKHRSKIQDFNDWLGELPHPYKVIIPGNHEFVLEANPETRAEITNAKLLINEGVTIAGLRIWGSPVTPLGSVAFSSSSATERRKLWARIPKTVDILVTHVPPYGILDAPKDSDAHEGCPELLKAVQQVQPRLHVFGHVHRAYGIERTRNTMFVNAEMYAEGGDLNKPVVVELAPR